MQYLPIPDISSLSCQPDVESVWRICISSSMYFNTRAIVRAATLQGLISCRAVPPRWSLVKSRTISCAATLWGLISSQVVPSRRSFVEPRTIVCAVTFEVYSGAALSLQESCKRLRSFFDPKTKLMDYVHGNCTYWTWLVLASFVRLMKFSSHSES